MKIDVKKLSVPDVDLFIELIRVCEDVFEMKNFIMPDRDYLQELLRKDTIMVYTATVKKILGSGLAMQQFFSKPRLLNIEYLGMFVLLQYREA